jgi:hypothetical protein
MAPVRRQDHNTFGVFSGKGVGLGMKDPLD